MKCRNLLHAALAGFLLGAIPVQAQGPQWMVEFPLRYEKLPKDKGTKMAGHLSMFMGYSDEKTDYGRFENGRILEGDPCTVDVRNDVLWVHAVSFAGRASSSDSDSLRKFKGEMFENKLRKLRAELNGHLNSRMEVRLTFTLHIEGRPASTSDQVVLWSSAGDALAFLDRWLKEDVLLSGKVTKVPEPLQITFLGDSLRNNLNSGEEKKR